MDRSGKRVIAVGIAVMDKIFGIDEMPSEATKVFARSYHEIGGGPAATGAVTAARLGAKVELWARVGDDPVGRRIVEEIGEWGVEPVIRHAREGRSGVSAIAIDGKGERLIFAFADPKLDSDPSWLPLERLGEADAVLSDLRWPRAAELVLREARRLGVPSVLDADLTTDDIARSLVPLADYAVFSAPALSRLTGEAEPLAGLKAAQLLCPGHVGVTVGAGGYRWLEAGVIRHEPGFSVEAIDTLGAGDVFHGAFALAIAEGRDVAGAARFANAASALKCTRSGGRAGIPTRAEVDRLLLQTEVL
ncbi:PfkB family carbohydrate kinase [Phreatobacter stygius]|uniref:Ribokinase n=1 Tax=Phreatobacter stygius TaxID=1940610 RepID=A0A4D7BD34_9HYPH|nr:PfkB family carbohydrate kinase [Phreatobacter stygius]QCI67286.1 ribokinase [Phreatobacter stygius]